MNVHKKIVDFLVSLGYTKEDGGLCHGMALRWIEACLLGEEKTFEERINYIVSHHKQLESSIRKIRKKNENLKKGDKALPLPQRLLDILAFCDSLELYNHPLDHTSLFNKGLQQSYIDSISYFASSDKIIERGGLVQGIYSEPVIYTQSEIERYLAELASMIESSASNESSLKKETFGMVLSSYNHAIALIYQQGGGWRFMDINQYPSKSFEVNQTTEIAELIVNGFEGSHYIAFNIEMVALGNNSQLSKLKHLLAQFKKNHVLTKEIASRVDDNNISLAHMAARKNDADVIAELAKGDADLNIASKDGITPAYIAAQKGHVDVIAELAKGGADLNIASKDGLAPAYIAAQKGHVDIVLELIKWKADLSIASRGGVTPAFIAAQNGHADVMTELVKQGADINTPFITSVDSLIEFASATEDSIRDRIKQFIDNQQRDVGSNDISITPYDIAVIMGHDKLVTIFINCNLAALRVRQLVSVIQSARDFNDVMMHSSAEQRRDIVKAMKGRLSALILSGNEAAASNALKDILLQCIQITWRFMEGLQPMPTEESVIFEAHLPNPERFADNLKAVLMHLPPESVEELADELRMHLPAQFNLDEAIKASRSQNDLLNEPISKMKANARAKKTVDKPSNPSC